jgi:hypothetical protein
LTELTEIELGKLFLYPASNEIPSSNCSVVVFPLLSLIGLNGLSSSIPTEVGLLTNLSWLVLGEYLGFLHPLFTK